VPSGRTHDGLTWGAVFPLSFGIAWYGDGWVSALLFGAGFLFGGLMFGPDLDLPSVQVRRWGPLGVMWKPYQRMFRHRSRWTHGMVVGPLIRILYLGVWVAGLGIGLAAIAAALGATVPRWERVAEQLALGLAGMDPAGVWYALLGIWGGSALHTAADGIVSGWKRLWRRGKSRR